MNIARQGCWIFWIFLLLPLTTGTAQETKQVTAESPAAVAENYRMEDVDKLLQELNQSGVDEESKAQTQQWLSEAKSRLEKAASLQADAKLLQNAIDSAASDIEQARAKKDSPESYDFERAESLDINQLNVDRSALEQKLKEARKELEAAQAEPQRRVQRKSEISGELTKAQESLAENRKKLEAIDQEDVSLQARAKLMQLRSDKQRIESLIKKLEKERDSYEAQGELPRLNIDRLTVNVKQLDSDIQELADLINERRTTDAQQQQIRTEQAVEEAAPALKPYAEDILKMTQRRLAVAGEINEAQGQRERTKKQLNRWEEDFERTKKRAAAVSSKAIGLMLEEKNSELPSISRLRSSIDRNESALNKCQIELYDLQDLRSELSDMDSLIAKTIRNDASLTQEQHDELKELFQLELNVLDGLLKDAERNYNLQLSAREDQQQLIDLVQQYKEYVNQKMFWVRSAKPISLDTFAEAGQAIRWLFNPQSLSAAFQQVKSRLTHQPLAVLLFTASIAILFLVRTRLRTQLTELGEKASRISCRSIQPTLQALWITIVLAAPWPFLFLFIRWLLRDSGSDPVRALSSAALTTSYWLMSLEIIRKVWRKKGLAEAHFEWAKWTGMNVGRNLSILFVAGSFFVFFCEACHAHGDTIYRQSLTRLSNIGWILLVGYVLFDVLRPDRGRTHDDASDDIAVGLMRKIGSALIVLLTLSLVYLAAQGFGHTAYQLTVELELTFTVLFGLYVLRALLFRWVKMNRRRMRREQLIEARQRAVVADDAMTSDIDALVAEEESTNLNIIDLQTRRLITVLIAALGIFSLYLIWYDSVQALTPIFNRNAYDVRVAGVVVRSVTWGSVLLALMLAAFIVIAFRNMKGLIDIVLSGQWAIESATRYAISTIMEYGIAIAGAFVVAKVLGFEWSNIQWLIAALGVGLGFGLQEIVANFICGIILLFEQPVRVGDVVTLGDTDGVVIRIRSRATTVRNWDRQEVIIPNKELITGRIINWTLSDDMSRISMNVGVAYGTDTNRVRELLRDITQHNENVLDDPAPIITFDQFADSTLNYTVRAFLAGVDQRLETTHQLHTEIHRRFAEEGIEIAFPQRDLHIRSDARTQSNAQPAWSAQDD